MSIYAISDLHLSFGADKPMDIFRGWDNYEEKIKANWTRLVTENDTVIIPGDVSWALTLQDSLSDLKWINDLPGKKILMKGNHDFWWSTVTKMKNFFAANSLDTLEILYNNAIETEEYILAGSRGWFVDKTIQKLDAKNHKYILLGDYDSSDDCITLKKEDLSLQADLIF